jgi:hypothetical protein
MKADEDWKVVSDSFAWSGANESPTFNEWPISVSHPEIRFAVTRARYVRLKLARTTGTPIINEFELYER